MQNITTLTELADILPEGIKEKALALLQEMSTPIEGIGDEPIPWKPGFLRLVQGTTDRGSLPKGTSIGDFVIGERKLEQPLRFIPILINDGRQYWDPDQTNNKMLCWSPDAKLGKIGVECRACPHAVWKEEEKLPSDCGKSKSVLAISSDLSQIFTIQFAKSNFKIGLELESAMKKAAVAPYLRTYGLTSATSSTAKNVENYKIEILDEKLRKTPAELIPFLKELFSQASKDRRASLETFYKNTLANKEAAALAAPPTVAAIENGSSTGTSDISFKEEVSEAKVSDLSKGYKI